MPHTRPLPGRAPRSAAHPSSPPGMGIEQCHTPDPSRDGASCPSPPVQPVPRQPRPGPQPGLRVSPQEREPPPRSAGSPCLSPPLGQRGAAAARPLGSRQQRLDPTEHLPQVGGGAQGPRGRSRSGRCPRHRPGHPATRRCRLPRDAEGGGDPARGGGVSAREGSLHCGGWSLHGGPLRPRPPPPPAPAPPPPGRRRQRGRPVPAPRGTGQQPPPGGARHCGSGTGGLRQISDISSWGKP